MKRAQRRLKATAKNNGSLAQLLAFWVNDAGKILGEQELVVLTLESLRDDIAQARTSDGKRVTDAETMREYLNEQISALRKVWQVVDAAD